MCQYRFLYNRLVRKLVVVRICTDQVKCCAWRVFQKAASDWVGRSRSTSATTPAAERPVTTSTSGHIDRSTIPAASKLSARATRQFSHDVFTNADTHTHTHTILSRLSVKRPINHRTCEDFLSIYHMLTWRGFLAVEQIDRIDAVLKHATSYPSGLCYS